MLPQLNCKVVPMTEVPSGDLRRSDEDRQPVILVVHDEVLVADCMAMLLARAGFTTRTAYDGSQALELAFELQPELLVSDIGIRGLDGIQLATAIVNAIPGCKVLLFSNQISEERVARARADGYDFPWIAKPVHPAEMLRRVLQSFREQDAATVQ